jgi:hypothetical protein
MKLICAAVTASAVVALAGPALAAEDNSALLAPIHGFVKESNANQMGRLSRFFTASPSLLDEFAPYHWSGPGAVQAWASGLTAASKQQGLSDAILDFGAPKLIQRQGRHAYVVAPCTVTFKVKGKAQRESGSMTFAMDQTPRGWRIAALAWTGSPAQ